MFINDKSTQLPTEKKRALLQAILINVLFWSVIFLFFTIRFDSVDDLRMAELAHGVFSQEYGNHLVFMYRVLTVVFQSLLHIAPNIEWYAVLWIFFVAISLFIISYIFIKNNSKYGITLVCILLLFFGLDFSINLQFTKVASVLTVAGMISIIDDKTNKQWFWTLIGTTLLLIGILIRRDAFFLALIPFGVFYAFIIIKRRRNLFRVGTIIFITKPLIAILWCVFIAEVLTMAFTDIRENQWQEYFEFNSYRAELSDLGFPEYDNNQEIYDSIGITKEDISYWTSTRNFADPDIINVDTAKKIVDTKKASEAYRNKDFFNTFLKKIVLPIFRYKWIYSIVIITLVYFLFYRKEMAFLLAEYIGIILCELYFSYIGRYHLDRVDKSLFFSLFCIVAWMILQDINLVTIVDTVMLKKIYIYIVLFALGIQLCEGNYKVSSEEMTDMVNDISNDKENLYLVTLQAEIEWAANLSAFHPKTLGAMSNILPIGGWMSNLPVLENVKENYSVENPFRDSVNKEHIYLLDVGDGTEILAYIQRHYCKSAYLEQCSSIGSINCFKVKSNE